MSRTITGIVEWLENWFYKKEDVNTYLNAKANKNLTNANMNVVTDSSGNITTEAKPTIPDVSGFIDTAGTGLSKSGTTLNHSNTISAQTTAGLKKIKFDSQGHITGVSAVTSSDLPSHQHSTQAINHDIALSNLNISPNSSQSQINNAINTAIGNLSSIRAIEVVSTLPTASSSTMGKLYIISENSKINVYYTEQSGSSYSWHKMDADILDELSIAWTDITGRPTKTSDFTNDGADGTNVFVANNDSRLSDARTPTSHTHGNLTNDGKVGSASGKIITTGTGGAIQASDSITKSMISDFPSSMTPTSHSHGQLTDDGKITSSAVTVASNDNIVITDYSDESKVKRVANLLTDHIKDSTAHILSIDTSANATQSTINFAIDNTIYGLKGTLTGFINDFDIVFVNSVPAPYDANPYAIYMVPETNGYGVYRHEEGNGSLGDYGSMVKKGTIITTHNNYVTSIALVPKATDSSGAITLYYGDEPT